LYIQVVPAEPQPVVSLEEPDDCRRFHVAIGDLSLDVAEQALEREDVGTFSDHNTAWIKITALRTLAETRVPPDWSERFDAMLRYAETKGWLSTDGTQVNGHCEWRQET
jgi:hypothetical protein